MVLEVLCHSWLTLFSFGHEVKQNMVGSIARGGIMAAGMNG